MCVVMCVVTEQKYRSSPCSTPAPVAPSARTRLYRLYIYCLYTYLSTSRSRSQIKTGAVLGAKCANSSIETLYLLSTYIHIRLPVATERRYRRSPSSTTGASGAKCANSSGAQRWINSPKGISTNSKFLRVPARLWPVCQ